MSNHTLYPASQSLREGYLKVSNLHSIWYAEYGNPKGLPVIFLHGGPGGGCTPSSHRFFDPDFYRIILLDQRGAPKSIPAMEMQENTTQHLVKDLEKLRLHLDIDKWLIFGGSWGSTLALTYGETYPDRCLGFILRGTLLGTSAEMDHFWYIQDTFPEAWQEMKDYLPKAEQNNIPQAYLKRFFDEDPQVSKPAIKAFMKYHFTCSFLNIIPEQLAQIMADEKVVLGCGKTFGHYYQNQCFLEEDQLLSNLHKIKHLPAIIIHGRYDQVCPAKTSFMIHQNWPRSEIVFVNDAGHSASEPGIIQALVTATDKFKKILR